MVKGSSETTDEPFEIIGSIDFICTKQLVSASQSGVPGKPANSFSDLYGVGMKQITHVSTGIENQTELMAGAIHHLRNAMETGSRRSCAVACMLFTCLAQDEALGPALCEAYKGLGECLEGLTECSAWGNQP